MTEIQNWAFAGCTTLKSVTIPASVRKIGLEAFYNCSALAGLTLPASVREIGPRAFKGCTALADENGLIIVKDVLYNYCGPGGEVVIPAGVREIGIEAFDWCFSLKDVWLPQSVKTIKKDALPHTAIHAPAGSYAEQYAKANQCRFVAEG